MCRAGRATVASFLRQRRGLGGASALSYVANRREERVCVCLFVCSAATSPTGEPNLACGHPGELGILI